MQKGHLPNVMLNHNHSSIQLVIYYRQYNDQHMYFLNYGHLYHLLSFAVHKYHELHSINMWAQKVPICV